MPSPENQTVQVMTINVLNGPSEDDPLATPFGHVSYAACYGATPAGFGLLRYTELDPGAAYRIRIVYSGDRFDTRIRLSPKGQGSTRVTKPVKLGVSEPESLRA